MTDKFSVYTPQPGYNRRRIFMYGQELVRIPKKRYQELIMEGKEIVRLLNDPSEKRRNMQFRAMPAYPRVEELEKYLPDLDTRESLSFIIFYSSEEIFNIPDDPEAARTREYLKRYFMENVDVIDDEDYEKIETISPSVWKSLNQSERKNCFSGLIGYYGRDEFETFVKDLGYMDFMGAYGCSRAKYERGDINPVIIHDLKKIWNAVQL